MRIYGYKNRSKYNIIIGDVFNDYSTPYHLTTLEFNKLVKDNLAENGIYLVNINDYDHGRYTPSFIHTLRQVFDYVYLFGAGENWWRKANDTLVITVTDRVIVATDQPIDMSDYKKFITEGGKKKAIGYPLDIIELEKYMAGRAPILLTDDHAPTDILLAPIYSKPELAPLLSKPD